jgi:hypothetical protein
MKFPSLREIIIGFIAAFFGLQIGSLVLSSFFPSLPIFKGGPIVLIFLLGISIMALFILGIRYDQLKTKENLVFVFLIFGLLVAAYVFLPKYLPQIFSLSPEISTSIRSSIASIFGGGV